MRKAARRPPEDIFSMPLVLRWAAETTYRIRTGGLKVPMNGCIPAQADVVSIKDFFD